MIYKVWLETNAGWIEGQVIDVAEEGRTIYFEIEVNGRLEPCEVTLTEAVAKEAGTNVAKVRSGVDSRGPATRGGGPRS